MSRTEELEWLRYFYNNADFGPAHEDVVEIIMQGYERGGKRRVPEDYRDGYFFQEEDNGN